MDRPRQDQAYSHEAQAVFRELDERVSSIFREVMAWRGWRMITDPAVPREDIMALVREIFRSVTWYQARTTEAGFRWFGRLPK
ncbi:MAG: hypothetical protein K0Q69_2863, partial [Devosia sp.]|nr:hypothetical protein [Devosia sp.]